MDAGSALLPGSFVFYRPKDIVSGDFYWVEQVDGKTVFAAVDCTGHGVPGAFMSLVGHNGLNQVVKERGVTTPAEVLDQLNRIAFDTLHKDRDQYVRDGMDMALCTFHPDTLLLEFRAITPHVVQDGEVLQFAAQNAIRALAEGEDLPRSWCNGERDAVYVFSNVYRPVRRSCGKKFRYRGP